VKKIVKWVRVLFFAVVLIGTGYIYNNTDGFSAIKIKTFYLELTQKP